MQIVIKFFTTVVASLLFFLFFPQTALADWPVAGDVTSIDYNTVQIDNVGPGWSGCNGFWYAQVTGDADNFTYPVGGGTLGSNLTGSSCETVSSTSIRLSFTWPSEFYFYPGTFKIFYAKDNNYDNAHTTNSFTISSDNPPPDNRTYTTIFSDEFTNTNGISWEDHNSLYTHFGATDGYVQNNQGIIGDGDNINVPSFADGCMETDITLPINNGVFLGLRDDGGNTSPIYTYLASTGGIGIQARNEGGGLNTVLLPESGTVNFKFCVEDQTARTYYNGHVVASLGLTSGDPEIGIPSVFGFGNVIDSLVVTTISSQTPTPTPTPTSIVTPIQTASYNGHTYYLLPSDNWTNSEATAQTLGGHLVTINDIAENTFVYNTFTNNGTINRGLWIGLNDAANEGTFVWATGEPLTFTRWGEGEPNNFLGIEDYVHLLFPSDPRSSLWNDAPDSASPFYDIPFYGVVEVVTPPDFIVSNVTLDYVTGDFSFDYTGYNGGGIVAVSLRNDPPATIYNWPAGEIGYGPLSCTSSHCSGSPSHLTGTISCSDSILFDIFDGTAEYFSNGYTVSDIDPSCSVTPTPTSTPTPSNQQPTVTWTTGTTTLDEGDTFTGTGSFTDPDSTSWTATVDYGDGTGTQPLTLNPDKTFSLSHVYVDNGTYTITVSITDNQGLTGTSTGVGGSVTVNNPPPVIDPIPAPPPIDQNTPTIIYVSYTDYGDQSHTATVNWGDGSTESTPVSGGEHSPTHNYQNPGTYTVIITVTDVLGATTTQTLTITVLNVAPEVDSITAPSPVWVNDSVPLSVNFTDQGTVDTHTASINWGDGNTTTGTINESSGSGTVDGVHQYVEHGTYTITVTVTDDDGGIGTATKEITVNNRPPYVNPLADAEINQGQTYSASGSFTDSDSTSWTATVDYDEEAGPEPLTLNPDKTFILSHQYTTAGEYTVTVVVTDDSGGTGTTMATVNVNALPVIDTLSDEILEEGGAYTVTSSFTDPDSTLWEATVNYGEGAGTQTLSVNPDKTFILSNLYEDNGTYNVVITVTDDNGAVDTETVAVTVTNANPQVGTVTASVNPIQVFSATTTTASFTDAGVLDTHTAVWDWGDGMTSLGNVTENNGSGSVDGSHAYLAAGVYEVTLTVTDNNNASDTEVYQYLSVYNPTPQGLFNGVRKFTTPAGSYTANPGLSGQVMFGITAKYQGATPTGDVSMDFNAADFEFEATSITTFVIANGNKATLSGTGTVNGNSGYTFLVTGLDGGSGGDDFIRFQIKDASNTVVFDSQSGAGDTVDPTALITAGNVVIH